MLSPATTTRPSAVSLAMSPRRIGSHSTQPFGGLADGAAPMDGRAAPPAVPGIGFEAKGELYRAFAAMTREPG